MDYYLKLPEAGSFNWKAPVATAADLPVANNSVGDARVTEDTSAIYIWNGSAWLEVATPGASPPGGSSQQFQYNNAGAFAGSASLVNASGRILVGGATDDTFAALQVDGTIGLTQQTTPGTFPASGEDYLYFKSDDNLYKMNSSGVESLVGSPPLTASDSVVITAGNITLVNDQPVTALSGGAPLRRYNFPSSGTAVQDSGSENINSAATSSSWTTGPVATWIPNALDTSGGTVQVNSVSTGFAQNGNTVGKTVSVWINTTDGGSDDEILNWGVDSSNNGGWRLYMNAGQIVWAANGNSIITPLTYNDGSWHNVIATSDNSSNAIIYVDGINVVSGNINEGNASNTEFTIGDTAPGVSPSPFMGDIADVIYLGYVATTGDVAILMSGIIGVGPNQFYSTNQAGILGWNNIPGSLVNLWEETAGPGSGLQPINSDRVLLGGISDDGFSTLQIAGTQQLTMAHNFGVYTPAASGTTNYYTLYDNTLHSHDPNNGDWLIGGTGYTPWTLGSGYIQPVSVYDYVLLGGISNNNNETLQVEGSIFTTSSNHVSAGAFLSTGTGNYNGADILNNVNGNGLTLGSYDGSGNQANFHFENQQNVWQDSQQSNVIETQNNSNRNLTIQGYSNGSLDRFQVLSGSAQFTTSGTRGNTPSPDHIFSVISDSNTPMNSWVQTNNSPAFLDIINSSSTNIFQIDGNADIHSVDLDTDFSDHSIKMGYHPAQGATSIGAANLFFGWDSGSSSNNVSTSVFIGQDAGYGVNNSSNSFMLGNLAGAYGSSNWNSAIMLGSSGSGSSNITHSLFALDQAGQGSNTVSNSVFLGYEAGESTTNISNSFFMGYGTADNSSNISDSVIIGTYAGTSISGLTNSIILGASAGQGESSSDYSIFIGDESGASGNTNPYTVAIGKESGRFTSNTSYNNYLGYNAGQGASNTSYCNFIGYYCGVGSSHAYISAIGYNSANNAGDYTNALGFHAADQSGGNANNLLALGNYAGYHDTVNNGGTSSSILIGDYTNTAGYVDSVCIGKGTNNSAANEMNLGNILFLEGIYSGSSGSSTPISNGQVYTQSPINSANPQTTYTGDTSGTAIYSMPFQGVSYKKFLINLQSLVDSGTSSIFTYPTAFTVQPYIYGDTAAVAVSSTNTTTFTLAATAGVTGNIFVEGY